MTMKYITDALLSAVCAGMKVCMDERSRCTVSFKPLHKVACPQVAIASQIVTSADLAVQEAILESLLNAGLGNCSLEAEEETPSVSRFTAGPNGCTIFVDPIDGTLTYSLGCAHWAEAAAQAGFSATVIEQTMLKTDPSLYGIVVGASVPDDGLVAICALPELGTVFHMSGDRVFRNGAPFKYSGAPKPTRIVIGRRLLDPDGNSAPFAARGIEVRWFSGSAPGVLRWILEDDCTGYTGLECLFDIQLAALIARCLGFIVTDRRGRPFVPTLHGVVDGIVIASTADESAKIIEALQQYD
jgi:fructose-1,6-bisphosphatase/inositol monophosphatase family enzyme